MSALSRTLVAATVYWRLRANRLFCQWQEHYALATQLNEVLGQEK